VQDFNVSATTLDDVLVPEIQPGLPSSLLNRRPDVVQAEANLKLSRADVDLARLAYLPNISLTGSVRLASDSLGDLLGDGTTTVSASAGLVQLILDNGSRGRNVERQRLELESALANYRETVIAAFNDIDVSLGNIELLRALGEVAAEDLKRAEESFRIAEARYREGVDDFQTVLISQNQLFDTRNSYFDNKLAQLNAAIAFYQSLGGGWQAERPAP
jgi:outer membrane protein TolC